MTPVRLRFPKSARLARASEFAQLKSEGRSFHGKLMVLSVLNTAPGTATRIGLITSRRVGGAVDRNRVRRRLRELVRAVRPRLQSGFWLVIVARQAAVRADFSRLRREWLELAQRSTVLLPECA